VNQRESQRLRRKYAADLAAAAGPAHAHARATRVHLYLPRGYCQAFAELARELGQLGGAEAEVSRSWLLRYCVQVVYRDVFGRPMECREGEVTEEEEADDTERNGRSGPAPELLSPGERGKLEAAAAADFAAERKGRVRK